MARAAIEDILQKVSLTEVFQSGETIRCDQTPGQARAWPSQARGWPDTYERETSLVQAAHRQQGREAQDRRSRSRARSRGRKPAKPSRLAAAAAFVRGAAAGAVVAVARRIPWAKDENDPIVLLETDHRRFEALFAQGGKTSERAGKTRARLLETLAAELNVHELLEEKILYPALESHPEARDKVLEGYQEHHVADVVVKELRELATSDETWGAKFKVLKENIEHHIKEEEREMFRTARAVLSREELDDLGARMRALRAEIEADGGV
jgi:hypothetical protein